MARYPTKGPGDLPGDYDPADTAPGQSPEEIDMFDESFARLSTCPGMLAELALTEEEAIQVSVSLRKGDREGLMSAIDSASIRHAREMIEATKDQREWMTDKEAVDYLLEVYS